WRQRRTPRTTTSTVEATTAASETANASQSTIAGRSYPLRIGIEMTRVRGALAGRDGLVQIAVVLAAGLAYEALRSLMTPDWPRALQNAREVASLERMLGISWEEPIQRARSEERRVGKEC